MHVVFFECTDQCVILHCACGYNQLGTTVGQLVFVDGSGDGTVYQAGDQVCVCCQGRGALRNDPQETTVIVPEGE